MKYERRRRGAGDWLKRMILLAFFLVAAGAARAEAGPATKAALNSPSRRVGIPTVSAADVAVAEELPEAALVHYDDNLLAIKDVALGRVDAYIYDEVQLKVNLEGGITGVRLLDEVMNQTLKICVGISPVSGIPDLEEQVNAFIAEMHANGTIADMRRRWIWEAERTMPGIELPEKPQYHLVVATTGTVFPFSYYEGTELTGLDIELAYRFAAWMNADLQFEVYDYASIVPAALTGKADIIMANLQYTEERTESGLIFSDVLYPARLGILVRDNEEKDSGAASPAGIASWRDYNGKRLGVLVGPLMEDAAREYFPESEYLLFNSYPDCVAALLTGKIDAYLGDEPSMKSLHYEQPEIDYIHERITENNYSFAFRKNDPKSAELCGELNAFLTRCLADGTMQELDEIWFGTDEARKDVDMSGLTGENGTIRVVTTSTDMPFSYIKDGRNVGYDIDLVVRFCRESGYALELGDVDFAGRIPAVQSGKYDFTTDMNVTPEREEQVLFSGPTSKGGIVLAVRSEDLINMPSAPAVQSASGAAAGFQDLNGKRAGVITGSFHDSVVAEEMPDSSISNYNSYTDLVAALKAGKIDFFLASTEVAAHLLEANDGIAALEEPVRVLDIGAMFAKTEKGEALRAQMDAFIERIRSDGTLDEIYRFWGDPANESTHVDLSGLTGEKGTLHFATSGTKVPVSFVANGQIAGTDPDIAVRFCRAYGYDIEVNVVDTAGIIPGIVTGMYDFSLSDMVVTEERKESVSFSIPYHGTELLALTRSADSAVSVSSSNQEDWLAQLKSSFSKTFLRESRWKLFLAGIGSTMLITVLSILFGTALGFLLFMLCRNGNALANGATRLCLWLVQGTPMVVLLMILYYIIFGRIAISGTAVAVMGFTLTFGAAVFGMLMMGVGTVDRGQYEAAYALGHSNRHTFFRIILPQAIPHILPAYRGEIVGLVKATAIVGYIAVQDLTKMGDIVRSRTYEAFFPLIAVTVIYFVLEGIFGFAIGRIQIRMDPKKRSRERILKGVKCDDLD